MRPKTEEEVNRIAQDVIERVEIMLRIPLAMTDDPEQRFVIVTQVAASLFGSAGASFQAFNPGTSREDAARATLAHIGSLMGAYKN